MTSCRPPIANRLNGTRTLLPRYPVGIRKARIAWGFNSSDAPKRDAKLTAVSAGRMLGMSGGLVEY